MNKSYYAIIPANVRYDKDLTPNAKLLYGEITALCNEKGYCWANNSYFAELYNASNRSVSKWIKQLIEKGYISSTISYKNGTKEIEKRYLYIGSIPMEEKFHRVRRKVPDAIEENFHTPIEEKFQDNTTSTNTTINTTFNSTTQSSAVVDTNIKLIESKTHLKLSKNMIKTVRLWEKDRLEKSIDLFLAKEGKYFSLLEKIYKDDGNFKANNVTRIINRKTGFHNFDESFDKYSDAEFDEIIKKSQKEKFG